MSNVKHKEHEYDGADELKIIIDPTDYIHLIEVMDLYHHLDYMLLGHNVEGESTTTSIYEDHIIVDTLQWNGWTRRNVYWRDGDTEELFSKSGVFK